jgi:quinol-cytochrome oxidoreductase complex cytochrome b subunit
MALAGGSQIIQFSHGVTTNDISGPGMGRNLGRLNQEPAPEWFTVTMLLILSFLAIVFGFLGAVVKDTGALAGIGIGLSVVAIFVKAASQTPGLSQGDKDLLGWIGGAFAVVGLVLALLGFTSEMKGAKVIAIVSTAIAVVALMRSLGI